MSDRIAIGVDLGGTNLKAAAVAHDGTILARHTLPVRPEQGPDSIISEMVSLVERLSAELGCARSDIVGVGVAAPGPLDIESGRIICAANLPLWRNVPLRDLLRAELECPVFLENDGNAAALGEYWAGTGDRSSDLVLLTLGTGVGGGAVLNGRPFHGHYGNAAELGHLIVDVEGLVCPCGQRGCLEQYCSAGAVARRVVNAVREGEASSLGAAVMDGAPVDAEDVARAAEAADPLCLRIWDDTCRYLAVACVNIQHTYNPSRIVLGGGMSGAGAFLLDRVTTFVERQKWSLHDDLPSVMLTSLGDCGGAVGAAALVWFENERRASAI